MAPRESPLCLLLPQCLPESAPNFERRLPPRTAPLLSSLAPCHPTPSTASSESFLLACPCCPPPQSLSVALLTGTRGIPACPAFCGVNAGSSLCGFFSPQVQQVAIAHLQRQKGRNISKELQQQKSSSVYVKPRSVVLLPSSVSVSQQLTQGVLTLQTREIDPEMLSRWPFLSPGLAGTLSVLTLID